MPWQDTSLLRPGALSPELQHQAYCGLDCCVALEVWEELCRLFNQPPEIYHFEKALQGPYLEIMQRGMLVDASGRRQASLELGRRIESLQAVLDEQARAIWSKGLNPRSPAQLKDFFYSALGLPEVWISQKGERKLSTNRETLEKLEVYLHARSIIACILSIRDLAKQREVFDTEIDLDGRFRASYNIAGTESGRPSSSSNAFGTGRNAQNIAPTLRWPFMADVGWKLGVVDLEQVEARDVGWFCGCLFGDWSYLNACESGDLHTANARLVWPERAWTGDLRKDRQLAEERFYREFSYRDMSKRGGHLTNYMGTPWTMSRHLKIPIQAAEEFQLRYCVGGKLRDGREVLPAYPCIPKFWQWNAQQLQTTRLLETPFGRRRHFFGRPEDDATLREAIAFLPSSTTADRMNLGLWRVWKYMPEVQLLGQGFDSITFQFPETSDEQTIIGRVLELIRVEFQEPGGRKFVVPGEAKTGWNWGAEVTPEDLARAEARGDRLPRLNPEGLRKVKLGQRDPRKRATGLGRIMW